MLRARRVTLAALDSAPQDALMAYRFMPDAIATLERDKRAYRPQPLNQ